MLTIIVLTVLMGLAVGWSIGANDAANSLGTAVGSKVLTLKQAIILICIFGVMIGGKGLPLLVLSFPLFFWRIVFLFYLSANSFVLVFVFLILLRVFISVFTVVYPCFFGF